MPIFEGSRYESATQLRVADADGTARPTLYPLLGATTGRRVYRTYIASEHERYDQIAQNLFDDPQLWWVIADLNPEFPYPDELPVGTVLRIPVES